MDSTAPSTFPASSSTSCEKISARECYINRLPVELLAAILEEHSAQELCAPFINSQVCRRWHGTTQLWPRVWSYITIHSVTEHKMPLHRIKTFLERSCGSPLHVNLEYPGYIAAEGGPSVVLFQWPVITRIQNLILKGTLPGVIRMVDGMPNLRSLQLKQCNWGGTIKFRLGIESFPLLEELVGDDMWSDPRVAVGSPVLLRTLSLSCIRHMEWANILSECRETLVEVLLDRCRLPPPAQIYFPNLRFLALSKMFDFRDDIVAPNLTTFHERPDPLDSLEPPFRFTSITEYACHGTYLSADDEPFLEGHILPNLERLALWGTWKGIREVLQKLVSYPQTVPKLGTIELAMEGGEDLSDSQWAEVENLFAHTPLSSTLKRRTDSRASYIPLRFSLTRRCLLNA